jgi:uncharacterized membrane protein YdjX (TVP38/TMEM64 family)
MYLSILGGAVWGMPIALPLVCCCVASGATLCYLISSALGPALLTLPKWKAMLDKWARKIQRNQVGCLSVYSVAALADVIYVQDNMISFLIVLRIAPLPPHWALNLLAPHVGISIPVFWISTALGILGVSVIHTTIGGGLDEMTSADDFKLISWKNFLGLSAVVVGVMIPVGLRYWFGRNGAVDVNADEDEEVVQPVSGDDEDEDFDEDIILAVGPSHIHTPKDGDDEAGRRLLGDDDSDLDEYDDEDDGDLVLESGPEASGSK